MFKIQTPRWNSLVVPHQAHFDNAVSSKDPCILEASPPPQSSASMSMIRFKIDLPHILHSAWLSITIPSVFGQSSTRHSNTKRRLSITIRGCCLYALRPNLKKNSKIEDRSNTAVNISIKTYPIRRYRLIYASFHEARLLGKCILVFKGFQHLCNHSWSLAGKYLDNLKLAMYTGD